MIIKVICLQDRDIKTPISHNKSDYLRVLKKRDQTCQLCMEIHISLAFTLRGRGHFVALSDASATAMVCWDQPENFRSC